MRIKSIIFEYSSALEIAICLLQTAVVAVSAAAQAVLSAGRSSLPQKRLTRLSVPAAALAFVSPP